VDDRVRMKMSANQSQSVQCVYSAVHCTHYTVFDLELDDLE